MYTHIFNKGILMCQTRQTIQDTCSTLHLSLVMRKPVFGITGQARHKPGCTATVDGYIDLKFWI